MKAAYDSMADRDFRTMIQVDMQIASFQSNWTHCDYIATYLARVISHNRPDSVLFSNLFSSVLNELLEITFRTRHRTGALACAVSRHVDTDRIEISFACGAEERRFFETNVSRIRSGEDLRARYLDSLSGDVGPSREMTLLELAVNYRATLSLRANEDETLTLVVDLPLGGLAN
ncbi:ubiquinone biosynthesis methyltransferase UbiE [Mesorhizobium sp. LHD-90]|uniref:ubiquinone biosynthesis methyltransferase UbiE n=1 Tax=Mesorhizobium sp. LHD-90 TaxID=3071414 RepID=UPI0027E0ED97|nr:ubiquinone biosynthesis methyltransferase UbiE [Mesorhizobium sp. LHD-90]MDQ6433871.1 ubiquinone biosynthesis methyltransferase UbiE [Mesorhizobium sp. LHD-90]